MAASGAISPELRIRLDLLEDPANQGDDFTRSTWLWLGLLGIILPVALMVWGWS